MGRNGGKRQHGADEPPQSREGVWVGSSKDDISAMPKPVKASFGYRLRRVQQGEPTADTKALPQFGAGVFELRESLDSNAYRSMYVVRLKHAIYVLHALMKKSKSGIALPREDVRLIQAPLKRAMAIDTEADDEKN